MKLSVITTLASFIAIGAAQPLEKGKRAIVTRTYTTEVVEIEYEYQTVYVTPGEVVATASATTSTSTQVNVAGHQKDGHRHQDFHKLSSTTSTSTSTLAPVEVPTSTPVPVQTPTPAPAPAPAPAPVQEPAPVKEPAPVETTTSTPAPAQQPAPVKEPAPVQTPTSTAAPVASPLSNSYSSGSSTADCGKIGAHCSGRISFYDITKAPGVYNACGWQSDGLTEDIVAMAAGMMPGSNGDPMCNRKVAITHNGKTVQATVVDKCPGCPGQALDLSHHLFDQLGNEADGVYYGVDWTFLS